MDQTTQAILNSQYLQSVAADSSTPSSWAEVLALLVFCAIIWTVILFWARYQDRMIAGREYNPMKWKGGKEVPESKQSGFDATKYDSGHNSYNYISYYETIKK